MGFDVYPESRSKLYHDRFRYAVRCYVPNAPLLRSLDHDTIVQTIQRRNSRPRRGFFPLPVKEAEAQTIHELCDLILTWTDEWQKTCYMDHLYVYTNSEQIINSIVDSGLVVHAWIGEAVVDRVRNAVVLRTPVYQLRTYFRERMLYSDQFDLFRNFVQTRGDEVKLNRTFAQRLSEQNCYVHRHYFMDHNDHHLPLLLQLVCPNLVRQTIPIIAK